MAFGSGAEKLTLDSLLEREPEENHAALATGWVFLERKNVDAIAVEKHSRLIVPKEDKPSFRIPSMHFTSEAARKMSKEIFFGVQKPGVSLVAVVNRLLRPDVAVATNYALHRFNLGRNQEGDDVTQFVLDWIPPHKRQS